MGVLIEGQGILGAFRGKVGQVIGYVRNGQACMRSMPSHYHDAKTDDQLRCRSKMTAVTGFLSTIFPVVKNGFEYETDNTTEFNEAVRYNIKHAMRCEGTQATMDYERVKVASGYLAGMTRGLAFMDGMEVRAAWEAVLGLNGACGTDKACLVAYDAAKKQAVWDMNCGERGASGCRMRLPEEWSGDKVHVWGWMKGEGCVSDSVYLGDFVCNKTDNSVENGMNFEGSADVAAFVLPVSKCYERDTLSGIGRVLKGGLEGMEKGDFGQKDDGGGGGEG